MQAALRRGFELPLAAVNLRAWLRPAITLCTLCAAALLLRLIPWSATYPLHRDEALYGFWARLIATGQDPLLLSVWVDKPPLVLYLIALSVKAFGATERALRVPGLVAGVLLIPATYGLALRIWDRRAALLAAVLVAASPFAILFSPTAFTDPWLALWIVAGAWAALARRPFAAGLALGLAIASKQQGILGAPLGLALLTHTVRRDVAGLPRRSATRATVLAFAVALVGLMVVLNPVTAWDHARWQIRPSFWDRSLTTYGPLRLVPPAGLPERAGDWAALLAMMFGTAWVTVPVMVAAAAGALRGDRPRNGENQARRAADFPAALATERSPAALVGIYVAGYLALHLIVSFQTWDRYLLPILPLISVLAAGGFLALARHPLLTSHPWRLRLAALILVALLGRGAWLGASARLPLGSDHSAYSGLDQVVAVLRSEPDDAIIYHRWLSWHFDFYLFDAPQERRWWGDGQKLAEDASQTLRDEPERRQWVVIPEWESAERQAIDLALDSLGLVLQPDAQVRRADGSLAFSMYRIVPRARAAL